jgi:hypothetical protein
MSKLEGWTWTVLVLLVMIAIPARAYQIAIFGLIVVPAVFLALVL